MTCASCTRPAIALAAALATAGCMIGTSARSFRPARQPQGVRVSLELMNPYASPIGGELLAVDDTALLVLRGVDRQLTGSADYPGPRVVLVSLQRIRVGRFAQLGARLEEGRFVRAGSAAQVRLVSRFPQGVRPELLAALLSAYGQSGLEVQGPR